MNSTVSLLLKFVKRRRFKKASRKFIIFDNYDNNRKIGKVILNDDFVKKNNVVDIIVAPKIIYSNKKWTLNSYGAIKYKDLLTYEEFQKNLKKYEEV